MSDDERTLDDLAAQGLDGADAEIPDRVRELYDTGDPVPPRLVERIRFALALDEMYDEVAAMTRLPVDSFASRAEDSEVRTETLTFSAEQLTAMVTVSRQGPDGLRLDGWLAPAEACWVRLRIQGGGEHMTSADADGRFSFEGLAEGFGQLTFHPGRDAGENSVVTPLFQL